MIFVTGASSSGKTTAIAKLLETRPGVLHIRASSSLQALGRPLRLLTKRQAEQNQEALVQFLAANGLRGRSDVILDGHAVIETTEGPLTISDTITDELRLTGIIGVHDSLSTLLRRQRARGVNWTASQAHLYQELEKAYVSRQAKRLGIPAAYTWSGNLTGFNEVLDTAQIATRHKDRR